MRCHTSPITFLFFVTVSLSALVSAVQFVPPEKVSSKDTYSLTLSTNPTRVLDTKHGRVVVETFDAVKSWNAEDVGPDNGKKWRFKNHMKSLFCEGGGIIWNKGKGGYVASMKDGKTLRTNAWIPWRSHIHLVPSGGGIKIKVHLHGKASGWLWLNEFGYLTKHDGAIWMITKTTKRVSDKHIREID